MSEYETVPVGKPFTKSYTIYHKLNGKFISPWHDISLFADSSQSDLIFNMVVEIPKWTNAKFEISTSKQLNPIIQDTKKGKLRFIKNCFPIHGYNWNYGAFPQTWEDSTSPDIHTGLPGDSDPVDVCEIGTKSRTTGEVVQVKVLGCIGLIDKDETDWKIIAIDITDPMASDLTDITDIDIQMPGFLSMLKSWFQIYKIPEGKTENKLAFDGEIRGKDFAREIVIGTHAKWLDLQAGRTTCENISLKNTQLSNASTITDATVKFSINELTTESDVDWSEVNKWYYVDGFKLDY
jgi:inorganic pyrophosphatase